MTIPPEVIDLLICCAGVDPEKGPKLEALISKGVDWNLVIEQGQRHGILPLLYWSLKTHCPDKVPDPIMKQLGDFFQVNARKNLLAISELLGILSLLEDKNIKAIPFKGPVLTSLLYGNPAMRCYGDLDILISKKDFPQAKKILVAIGYLPKIPTNSISQEAILIRSSYEYSFCRKTGERNIDVHWGFYLKWLFDPMNGDQQWIRVEKTSLGGETISTLSNEDLLIVLSIHGAMHCWSNLKLVSDLANLIEVRKIDWLYVFQQALLKRCQRMIFTGLLLANGILEAPVPEEMLHKAKTDGTALLLAKKVRDRFYSNVPLGIWSTQAFLVLSNDRLADGLRPFIKLALTPSIGDWQATPLPKFLYFMYFLTRPIRLFKTYFLGLSKDNARSA